MYRLDVSDSGLSFAIGDCQIFDAVVYSFKYFIPVAIAMGNLIMRVCGNHDFALNMQKSTVTVASTEKRLLVDITVLLCEQYTIIPVIS